MVGGGGAMLVFFRERLVFLSVPKTGSTAFESALRDRADMVVSAPPELKHMPLFRYNRFMRPMFEKVLDAQMETIAVVREPLDWLGSWYRYRRRPEMKGHRNGTHHVDFDGFLEAYMQDKRPSFANVGSQAKFVEPRPNGTRLEHLFRYDRLDRLTAFLEDRLQTKVNMRRENESPAMALTISPEVEVRLRQVCRAEFDVYKSAG